MGAWEVHKTTGLDGLSDPQMTAAGTGKSQQLQKNFSKLESLIDLPGNGKGSPHIQLSKATTGCWEKKSTNSGASLFGPDLYFQDTLQLHGSS